MVCRPAIRKFLSRASSATLRRGEFPQNGRSLADPLQGLLQPDGVASSQTVGVATAATAAVAPDFGFSAHFSHRRRSNFFHAAASPDDEDRSQRGACFEPFAKHGDAWSSAAMRRDEEEIGTEEHRRRRLSGGDGVVELGGEKSYCRFSERDVRSSVSSRGVLLRGQGFGNGSTSYGLGNGTGFRFYSAAAAAASEGTQIAVDGNQLDSLQAAMTGAGGAESAAAAIPQSDALGEVAAAVVDCSVPTAFVQYVIDSVHVSTGLPWWSSIAATTVAIRFLVLPIMIYQMKSTARLTLLRPELEKLTNRIKESNYEPKVVGDNQVRMKALFAKHKTTPFSPILGAFVQAPIFMCFFFGIRNMAEKIPSFKEGGMWWFTDLSTPDSLFIMPVLSGAFFLLTVELGAADGMQGQPMLGKMKNFMRGLSVLLVPLTASFPKALFCYWLTANVFSLAQAAVLKQPGVKSVLGIPDVSHLAKPADVPVAPLITYSQPPRLKAESKAKRRTS